MKIVILEDELIVVKDLSRRLSKMGYTVIGTFTNGADLVEFIRLNEANLILADINIEGKINGIETIKSIKKYSNAPVIYITAQADKNTFSEAKETKPMAYLTKPYNDFDLQTTIELAFENFTREMDNDASGIIVNNNIYVRGKNRYEKIAVKEIEFLEAAGNYTDIFTTEAKHTVTMKIGQIEEALHLEPFFRCHRSFMVNLTKVDGFDDAHIFISNNKIPISKSCKKAFLDKLRIL
ncbi:response regulator [bacterium]|nr:response regulator [bacterium]